MYITDEHTHFNTSVVHWSLETCEFQFSVSYMYIVVVWWGISNKDLFWVGTYVRLQQSTQSAHQGKKEEILDGSLEERWQVPSKMLPSTHLLVSPVLLSNLRMSTSSLSLSLFFHIWFVLVLYLVDDEWDDCRHGYHIILSEGRKNWQITHLLCSALVEVTC